MGQSLSHSVSDKVTYWAVRWQLKIEFNAVFCRCLTNLSISSLCFSVLGDELFCQEGQCSHRWRTREDCSIHNIFSLEIGIYSLTPRVGQISGLKTPDAFNVQMLFLHLNFLSISGQERQQLQDRAFPIFQDIPRLLCFPWNCTPGPGPFCSVVTKLANFWGHSLIWPDLLSSCAIELLCMSSHSLTSQ